MSRISRCYPVAFKLSVCERMEASGNLAGLARELGLRRATLYLWRARYLSKGEAGLRGRGRPPGTPPVVAASADTAAAARGKVIDVGPAGRIAELERKIGQQALELDFFRAALRRVGAARR